MGRPRNARNSLGNSSLDLVSTLHHGDVVCQQPALLFELGGLSTRVLIYPTSFLSGASLVPRETLAHSRKLIFEESDDTFPLLSHLPHVFSFVYRLINRLLFLSGEAVCVKVDRLQLILGHLPRRYSLLFCPRPLWYTSA